MLTNLFFDKTHFDRMVTNLIFDKTHFERNGWLHVRIDILNSKNASMNFVTNVPSYVLTILGKTDVQNPPVILFGDI